VPHSRDTSKDQKNSGTPHHDRVSTVAASLCEPYPSPTGRRLQPAAYKFEEPHDGTHHAALRM